MFGIKTTLARARAYSVVARALDSGLPMPSALRLLAPARAGSIEGLLAEAAQDVEQGSQLGASLRRRAAPGQIRTAELRLIEVGERVGRLPDLLRRIAARLEERAGNRRTVVAGLIYPTILVHAAVLAAAAPLAVSGVLPFLGSVAPRFLGLWSGALVAYLLFRLAVSRPDGRRRLLDATARLPVIGKAVKASAVGEYAYSVGVALSAGLPMPESLRLGGEASRWTPLVGASRRMASAIDDGATMTQAHRLERVIPKEIVESVCVGEASGTLDETFAGASRMFSDIASRRAAAIAKALPLVIYLLVAIYVGFVVISAYLGLLTRVGGV
jgi:type II secretory pathway component PulF